MEEVDPAKSYEAKEEKVKSQFLEDLFHYQLDNLIKILINVILYFWSWA